MSPGSLTRRRLAVQRRRAFLRRRAIRRREAPLLLALALAAGSLDALSYLGLHRVFPANMTGNTVLLAVAVARGSGADATRSAAALGGFALGVLSGTLLMPRRPGRWPGSAALTLLAEAIALLALAVWWASVGASPVRYWLILLAGAAMGSQSTAVHASHVNGVTTTYMTGTFMHAIVRAVNRLRRAPNAPQAPHVPNLPGAAWIVYLIGALIGAVAERAWHAYAVLIPLGLVLPVVLLAVTRREEPRHGSERSG